MGDWANLPLDLLTQIAKQLHSMNDFVCFGVVCKSWSLATSTLTNDLWLLPPKLPCLMLAEEEFDDQEIGATTDAKTVATRSFFSLSTGKTCKLELPEISGRKCLGLNYGWVFTVGNDLHINLFHPFSRNRISLPPFSSNHYDYHHILLRKVALATHPKRKDCVVMAIFGEFAKLAFARPRDRLWTNVPVLSNCYQDVIYFKGHFYAVDCNGVVIVCDIECDQGPKSTVLTLPPVRSPNRTQKYLVESSGDLLLVSHFRGGLLFDEGNDDFLYYTIGFSVLRMEKCSKGKIEQYPYCWVPVKSLGDQALFLGENTSVSLSASEYNGSFRANCIYFTDGNPELYGREVEAPGGREMGEIQVKGGRDMGIFDMEDGTIEQHYAGVSLSYISPPIWIT